MSPRLPDILQTHLDKGLPLVAYRKPGQEVLTILLQDDLKTHRVADYSESGFVFAPFVSGTNPILLKPDASSEVRFPPGDEEKKYPALMAAANDKDEVSYQELVSRAKSYLSDYGFRKVVISRRVIIEAHTPALVAFERLLHLYPNAFCYLWFHPETGLWTGATPELLLHVEEEIYRTMSLAGTIRYHGEQEPDWGNKEREEQEIVTSFLLEAIEDKVESVNVSGPFTVKAGDLLHLQSRISGRLGTAGLENIIAALHPSPAVCGLPRQQALDFINTHEGYDRAYYAGYLGELNYPAGRVAAGSKQAQLYVNLRCMSLANGQATIYVGGGITPASCPEAEWQETVNKSGTMLAVLFNSPQ